MPPLNPDHLFDQADKLIAAPQAGPPRQVDLRRAISNAYYGVFHFTLTCLADEFVGASQRATGRYMVVYRTLDHRILRDVCSNVAKQPIPPRYSPFVPGGVGANIHGFAIAAVDLQAKRHRADYDPEPRFLTSDARLAISTARSAVGRFRQASEEHRKAFLTLLLCPPR